MPINQQKATAFLASEGFKQLPPEARRQLYDAIQTTLQTQPKTPSYWDVLTNPVGSGAVKQGVMGGARQIGGQAIEAGTSPFRHPIDTITSFTRQASDITNPYAFGMDVAGPMTEGYRAAKEKGGNALAIENLIGNLLGTVEGGRAIGGVTERIPPINRPPAPLTESVERFSSAIDPSATGEARLGLKRDIGSTARELTETTGEVPRKGATSTLETHARELSKRYQAADDAFMKQYGDARSTTVFPQWMKDFTNTKGQKFGNAAHDLNSLREWLKEANEQSKPNFIQSSSAVIAEKAARAKLAGDQLRQALNTQLSQLSGIDPKIIAGVRERAGLYSNMAESLESRRLGAQQAGFKKGGSVPTTRLEAAHAGIQKMLGGTERAANRAVGKTYKSLRKSVGAENPPDALSDWMQNRPEELMQKARERRENLEW